MKFWEQINEKLQPWEDKALNKTVVDLFAGCGGLSLGFEAQGFRTIGYEMDEQATNTYNKNLHGDCIHTKLDPDFKYPKAEVLIGGPPCQPFSVGGNQKGLKDSRDGFPIFINAVKQLEPEVLLFENVRGMLYKNKWYLKEVLAELTDLGYQLNYALLNAKNYGVPQNRERVIVVGASERIPFPAKSKELITAGDALGSLAFEFDKDSKFLNKKMDAYVARYEKASHCITPRDLHLDRPARTLTCRNLAGSTSDMHRVKLKDGRRRRITVREAARLQSFPDWFEFQGSETQQYNQIGNAVAPMFAYQLAGNIKQFLLGSYDKVTQRAEEDQLTLFEDEAVYQS